MTGLIRPAVIDLSILRLIDIGLSCHLGREQLLQAMAGEKIPGGFIKIHELGQNTGGNTFGRCCHLICKGHIIGIIDGIDQIPQPGHIRFGQLAVRNSVPLLDEILRRSFHDLSHALRPAGAVLDGQSRFLFRRLGGLGTGFRRLGAGLGRLRAESRRLGRLRLSPLRGAARKQQAKHQSQTEQTIFPHKILSFPNGAGSASLPLL